jgi:hypothetical protein
MVEEMLGNTPVLSTSASISIWGSSVSVYDQEKASRTTSYLVVIEVGVHEQGRWEPGAGHPVAISRVGGRSLVVRVGLSPALSRLLFRRSAPPLRRAIVTHTRTPYRSRQT